MAKYAVARLDEIDEIDDGQRPFRAVRQHFGISTFGITAMTAHADGDPLIPEHDESNPHSSEELYVVVSGHATFKLDEETQDAPAGTSCLSARVSSAPRRAGRWHDRAGDQRRAGGQTS